MLDLGKWKIIKLGFWLGIGFIIPQIIVLYGGSIVAALAMPAMMEMPMQDTDVISSLDRKDQIEIGPYEDKSNATQLLILGTIVNTGSEPASSIQLEAELFDAEKKFVYECTEYISNRVMPGESENYQIKCGCSSSPIPKYSTINVRVVGAHGF